MATASDGKEHFLFAGSFAYRSAVVGEMGIIEKRIRDRILVKR